MLIYDTIIYINCTNNKQTQHPPDDFYEEQTFKKAFYNKIWRLRGVQDGLEGLQVYKPKKKNEKNGSEEKKGVANKCKSLTKCRN